ncbi:MAG TPA: 2-phospho-L-lactate guanylyltransferase [Dehalococcoidia bacterium]|nr:2-phospho-L-lactate guanylyltransferase [Dehalococcoidia bacterium]
MIAALVPAKALDQAKGRLAAALGEDERRLLALAMLEDVLRSLQGVPRIELVAVVSPDEAVLSLAADLGAEPIAEPPSGRGINQALSHGRDRLAARRIDALLVLLADCPAVTPAEIEAVLDALPSDHGAVICPSSAKGTSLLALRPPDAVPFRFGPRSFQAHKRECAAAGLPLHVLHIPSLAADIDAPEDLLDLMSRPAETATHALLARLALRQRLTASPAAPSATRPTRQ